MIAVKVALGELEDEVKGMLDESAVGLEEALLDARPSATNSRGERQNQPTHEIADVRQ